MCSYPDLRLARSFPTRRSSDLTFRRSLSCHDRTTCCRSLVPAAHSQVFSRRAGQGLLDFTDILIEYAADYQKTRTDRKSTRLNSSHSQISYAVFCLKKKN